MKLKKFFFASIIVLVAITSNGAAKIIKRGIVDNIQSGIKYAGKILGIDTASDVADLVSRAFSKTMLMNNKNYSPSKQTGAEPNDSVPQSSNEPPKQFMSGLFRLMGLDPSKLGALALNGLVFIAKMIGKSLTPSFGNPPKSLDVDNVDPLERRKQPRSFSALDWIYTNTNENEQLNKLLVQVRDKNLPQNLIEMLGSMEKRAGDGDCIKLLICKSAPFVWGMQKAIHDRIDGVVDDDQDVGGPDYKKGSMNSGNRLDFMYKYIPDLNEFKIHGDACEEKYEGCQIYDSP